MFVIHIPVRKRVFTPTRKKALAHTLAGAAASIWLFAATGASAAPAPTETLTRSVVVDAPPSQVWAVIGPFCAIEDWLPPVGTCTQNGHSPPTRTLLTRDGSGTFIETQVARDDQRHFYTYMFRASPVPVAHYKSTLQVTSNGPGRSTVTWSATYIPNAGKAAQARDTLTGVYETDLGAIEARFANTVPSDFIN